MKVQLIKSDIKNSQCTVIILINNVSKIKSKRLYVAAKLSCEEYKDIPLVNLKRFDILTIKVYNKLHS